MRFSIQQLILAVACFSLLTFIAGPTQLRAQDEDEDEQKTGMELLTDAIREQAKIQIGAELDLVAEEYQRRYGLTDEAMKRVKALSRRTTVQWVKLITEREVSRRAAWFVGDKLEQPFFVNGVQYSGDDSDAEISNLSVKVWLDGMYFRMGFKSGRRINNGSIVLIKEPRVLLADPHWRKVIDQGRSQGDVAEDLELVKQKPANYLLSGPAGIYEDQYRRMKASAAAICLSKLQTELVLTEKQLEPVNQWLLKNIKPPHKLDLLSQVIKDGLKTMKSAPPGLTETQLVLWKRLQDDLSMP